MNHLGPLPFHFSFVPCSFRFPFSFSFSSSFVFVRKANVYNHFPLQLSNSMRGHNLFFILSSSTPYHNHKGLGKYLREMRATYALSYDFDA